MSKVDIIRAWKDEDYRLSLSDSERAQLPDNPAGLVELNDSDLNDAAGGTIFPTVQTCMLCESMYFCPSMVTVCPSYNYCPSQVTVCPKEPMEILYE
jgi:mersacidin/lichenicidin family type 2 lantibiotic